MTRAAKRRADREVAILNSQQFAQLGAVMAMRALERRLMGCSVETRAEVGHIVKELLLEFSSGKVKEA